MEDNLTEENGKLDFHLLEDDEIYRIRMYGDPVLHERALPIEAITEEDHQISKKMLATMYSSSSHIFIYPRLKNYMIVFK